MSEPLILCPTCREAVPDRLYYPHQLQPSHNPIPTFNHIPLANNAFAPRKNVADKPRMVLAGFDLSQIEARVELMLAAGTDEFYGTDIGKECIRIATAHPTEFDIHTYIAAIALDKPESEITDIKGTDTPSERQIGKTTGHGFMRGMGADTMSDSYLKKGFVVTPETCAKRLGKIATALPAIPEGFFPSCCRQMMRFRGLGTTFGGIWRCDWQALGAELYGSGYSYQPQRECADLLNQCGFLPLRRAIKQRLSTVGDWTRIPRINVHAHDALAVSVYPDDVYPMFHFIEQTLAATTRRYYAGSLTVPVTYALGSTWKAKFDWKRLPSEQEVRDAAWACVEGEEYVQ